LSAGVVRVSLRSYSGVLMAVTQRIDWDRLRISFTSEGRDDESLAKSQNIQVGQVSDLSSDLSDDQ